jgi:hypothetical protein
VQTATAHYVRVRWQANFVGHDGGNTASAEILALKPVPALPGLADTTLSVLGTNSKLR